MEKVAFLCLLIALINVLAEHSSAAQRSKSRHGVPATFLAGAIADAH
jgi:hypothetical protein